MRDLQEKSTTHTISQLCTCMQNITGEGQGEEEEKEDALLIL